MPCGCRAAAPGNLFQMPLGGLRDSVGGNATPGPAVGQPGGLPPTGGSGSCIRAAVRGERWAPRSPPERAGTEHHQVAYSPPNVLIPRCRLGVSATARRPAGRWGHRDETAFPEINVDRKCGRSYDSKHRGRWGECYLFFLGMYRGHVWVSIFHSVTLVLGRGP